MRSIIGVIAPTTTRLLLSFGGFNGNASLSVSLGTADVSIVEKTTSLTTFVELASSSYSLDKDRSVDILNLYLDLLTFNSANGRSKLQISGDGGNTWIDMTDEINGGTLSREGPGLWISSVQNGDDQLKIRWMGRSSDGALATLRLILSSSLDVTVNYQ